MGLRWALVGGFAVILRAESRSTHDLDIVLAVSGEREADKAILGLRLRGYGDHPKQPMLLKDGRVLGVRLLSPQLDEDERAIVDVLTDCAGIDQEIVAAAEALEVLPNVFIPVAQPEHLIALKILAGRPQDLEDIRVLFREVGTAKLQAVHQALELIEVRGFSEGKDLPAELAKLLDTPE